MQMRIWLLAQPLTQVPFPAPQRWDKKMARNRRIKYTWFRRPRVNRKMATVETTRVVSQMISDTTPKSTVTHVTSAQNSFTSAFNKICAAVGAVTRSLKVPKTVRFAAAASALVNKRLNHHNFEWIDIPAQADTLPLPKTSFGRAFQGTLLNSSPNSLHRR